jgi:Bacteriophage HK97-gp10, putative tail-component
MPSEGVDVKIRGVRQLSAGTRDLFGNIDRATVNDAVRVSAEQTAATIRSRVPVKSGRLRASVRNEMHGRTGSVVMGAGLPYAGWIEYGTWGGRKGPRRGRYVYPTAKRTERAFVKHCQTATESEIRGMRWPTPR